MHRRRFLQNLGLLSLAGVAPFAVPARAAPLDRRTKWKPDTSSPLIAAEWRYLAGTCRTGATQYGFVVSLGMTRSTKAPYPETYQLLVEKTNLDDGSFVHAIYDGVRSFEKEIDRYIFTGETEGISAVWEWDDTSGVYRLGLATPELSFSNMVMRPYGDLIPEGGSGTIDVGETAVRGVSSVIGSSYHADWVQLELPSASQNMSIGTARLDMQSLYPTFQPAEAATNYNHNWFAIQAELEGEPVYISAWRIESTRGPRWDVTIAHAVGGTWVARSYTEKDSAVQPLQVTPLSFQSIPDVIVEPNHTGSSWHLGAGAAQANDLLNLQLSVNPGQFISTARLGQSSQGALLEAISTEASGSVLGRPLSNVRLVVAESSSEALPSKGYVPLAGL